MSTEVAPSRFSLDDPHPIPPPPPPPAPIRSLKATKTMVGIVGSFTKGISSRNTAPKSKEPAKTVQVDQGTPATQNASTNVVQDPGPSQKPQSEMPPAKPANSKSQSMVSRVASKLRPKNSSAFRPPPMSEPITAQGRREAALRARGLLPQKDLSEQERERDLLIPEPVVTPPGGEQALESAADAIKREWEAKNAISSTPRASPPPPLDLSPLSLCDPCQVPLPPSPTPPDPVYAAPTPHLAVDGVSLDEACLVPLPLSPSPPSLRSTRSSISLRSAPKTTEVIPPHTAVSSATVTPLHSAIILPQTDDLPPSSPLSAKESESVMAASIATPSLSADSVVSRSVSGSSATSATEPLNTPVEGLKIQTLFPSTVPAIMESPVEDSVLASVPEAKPEPEPVSAKTEGEVAKPRADRVPVRRATDSAATQPRKDRKLSIRNIHRSVVGSIYRPRTKSSGFDASKLPPSPTKVPSPVSPTSPVSPRVGCRPAIHTSGSILLETSLIEDEESRRLSEMAFLT